MHHENNSMSPQSRATVVSNNTTFDDSREDGWPGNPCSGTSSVADITRAANVEYALHKIESESSATPANPLMMHQETTAGAASRKRSSARISSSPKNQPFLSSYGSAFLSGIFSDIAQASSDDDDENQLFGSAASSQDGAHPVAVDKANEPCQKKARISASTSFGRQPKSYTALGGLVEGANSELPSPSVVSPRPNTSTLKIQLFNDQVQQLQDMAFPSLPQIPITVSSSSCSAASNAVVTPRDECTMGEMNEDQDPSESYGWFVNMDDDVIDTTTQNDPAASMFLPDTKPDLAFNAITAPSAPVNQEIEVQQALAADTIDDVLGDLF